MEPNTMQFEMPPPGGVDIGRINVEGFIVGTGRFELSLFPNSPPKVFSGPMNACSSAPMPPPNLPDSPPPGVAPQAGVSGRLGDGQLAERLLNLATDPRVQALLRLFFRV